MKTLTITLRRDEARATCVLVFRDATWPESQTWSGDPGAFRLEDGDLPDFQASLRRVREDVEFQAAQSGASFSIREEGEEPPMREDRLVGGEENLTADGRGWTRI
jgi:hypothetical protein